MSDFRADNIFQAFSPTIEAVACMSDISYPTTIRPEDTPILVGVEAVREKGAPATAPQLASRYNIVFPGSDFLRLSIKVDEPAPSISTDVLAKYRRGVPVQVEGFRCGLFPNKDGGLVPYYKAQRVLPIKMQTQTQPAR